MKNWLLVLILIFILSILAIQPISAQNKLEIFFFYSKTCPHCIAEQKFLDDLEEKYAQEIKINRYFIGDAQSLDLLKYLLRKHNAEKYFGAVPLTFIGEDFIPGFDNPEGIGQIIENSIQRQLINKTASQNQNKKNQQEIPDKTKIEKKLLFNVPIIGQIDAKQYSLPILAIILGSLDGFNACSLGALVLILGLVLILRSRKRILIFGGAYILTTGVVYGVLIFAWYKIFSFFASYQTLITFLVALLGIGGGVYFLKEFIKQKKYGPVCETTKSSLFQKLSSKLRQQLSQKKKTILGIVLGIFLFALVITVVEFPCSAAAPLFFASVLAKARLPIFLYFLYIVIYIFFYMLDEILIFLIAVFTLRLRLASPKFVTWIILMESIVLFALGFYYLLKI